MIGQTRFEPCQVCGEQSSGLHCNAVTCEACKKFFLRSIHGEHKKYRCARDKKCTVTRNTRTQCQYCRFSKCLSAGMGLKGEDVQTPTVTDLFKRISCYVCGAPSSGIHFGAITCEGCKGFFRRSIKERAPGRYQCQESGNCDVNVANRNGCKHCRFQKCIKVGMSVDASRIGRQSNLFKHHIMTMQRNGQIPSTVLHAMSNNTGGMKRVKRRAESPSQIDSQECPIQFQIDENLSEMQFERFNLIFNAYKDSFENLPFFNSSIENSWISILVQFRDYAQRVIKFAHSINEFLSSSISDQMNMIRSSIHSIIILIQSRGKHWTTWNYLNCVDESDNHKISQVFPLFSRVSSDKSSVDVIKWIDRLYLDQCEFSLVLAIFLISTANAKVVNHNSIDILQTDLMYILLEYMDRKRGLRCRDYYTIMLILPKLKRVNRMVQEALINDSSLHNKSAFPNFFWKLFISDETDDDNQSNLNLLDEIKSENL